MIDETYKKIIFDYYKVTSFRGPPLWTADFTSQVYSQACGDSAAIWIKNSENGNVCFAVSTQGCILAVATANILAELANRNTIDCILSISSCQFLETIVKVPIDGARKDCAIFVFDHLQSCLRRLV